MIAPVRFSEAARATQEQLAHAASVTRGWTGPNLLWQSRSNDRQMLALA